MNYIMNYYELYYYELLPNYVGNYYVEKKLLGKINEQFF